MNSTNKTVAVIVAIVIAVIIFFGGYKYGESKSGVAAGGGYSAGGTYGVGTGLGRRAGGAGGAYGARGSASSTMGTILSVDSNSITVQLSGGGSKIVFVSTSTPVLVTSTATLSSLQVGQNVSVQGTTNSDGSESATSVMVRPAGMTGMGARGGATSSAAAPTMPAQQPSQY